VTASVILSVALLVASLVIGAWAKVSRERRP